MSADDSLPQGLNGVAGDVGALNPPAVLPTAVPEAQGQGGAYGRSGPGASVEAAGEPGWPGGWQALTGAAPFCSGPRLWLVRHPRPLGGEGLCYGRRTDLDVAPDEVQRVALRLAAQVPAGWRVRCSPARRCRLLAEALLRLRHDLVAVPGMAPVSRSLAAPDLEVTNLEKVAESVFMAWPVLKLAQAAPAAGPSVAPISASGWGPSCPDGVCPLLAEMNFGDWEGRPWAGIPVAELTAWTDDFADYVPGGQGESLRQFLHRVSQALAHAQAQEGARGAGQGKALAGGPEQAGELWITHAGVIRAVSWLLGAGRQGQMPQAAQWPAFAVGYGEIWQVPVGAGRQA